VTDGQTDGKTNRQNYDSQDRASIAASRGKKPHVGASERNIVTEVTIPTARATQSLETFLAHNAGVINDIVDDYQR